jgi:Zn-dependent M28 family amino/carboxypeptidase
VILSAHYDSRGSFGSTRAPGANDDGSGTVALLAIARTIKRRGIKFKTGVEFCAFSGEEQGCLGVGLGRVRYIPFKFSISCTS